MPIYEYRCAACEAYLEKLQRVTDAPITKCPECGQPRLKRLVSLAGFRLKGSGWYETDFKHDKRRNMAGDAAPKADKEKTGSGGEKTGGTETAAGKTVSKASDKAAAGKAGD